jgi:Gas vesicle synthesis protein GvpL/GvpF
VKKARAAPAAYLYCLVQRRSAPPLARAPRGLPGVGRPRAVAAGPALWLVVASAPLPRYAAASIERGLRDLDWVSRCAVAHEGVVEHVGRRAPVVPMKLFTLFTTEARALDHIRRQQPRLRRVLARVGDCQEWGVRISLDPARAAAAGRRPASPAVAGRQAGTRFLRRRRDEQAARGRLASQAQPDVERAYRTLARLARTGRRQPLVSPDGRPVALLDAAFLVPRAGEARFRTAVRLAARRLAGRGCAVALTGPWPPYNFVDR